MKKIFSITLVFLFSILLVSCGTNFKVTFDTDGATSQISSQELKKNELVIKPADPIKENYEFEFWVDLATNEKFEFTTKVTKDYNLKATYKVKAKIEEFKVIFDFGFDNLKEEVLVANNTKITSIPSKDRAGFKLVNWTKDNVVFDFETTINENITLVAVWRNLSEKDYVLEYLNTVNYSSLLSKGLNLNLEVNLGDVVTPFDPLVPSSALGMRFTNLTATIDGSFNPLKKQFYLDASIVFDSIDMIGHQEGEVITLAEDWFVGGRLNQLLVLSDNKLYSNFAGYLDTIEEESVKENPLEDVIGSLGMFIPEEYRGYLEEYGSLLENYEEYIDFFFDSELMLIVINQISPYLGFLNAIPEELIKYSPFKFVLDGNKLEIENKLFQPFKITMEKESNHDLKELTLDINFDGILVKSVLTTNPVISLPDFKDFKKVENLRLEKILEQFNK